MAFSEVKVDRPLLLLDNDDTSTTMARAVTSNLSSSSPPSPSLPSTSTPTSPSLAPTHPQNTTPTSSIPRAESGAEGRGGGRRRKAPHPQKTLPLMDPNFRGVTLCFQIAVQGGHSRLLITPFYSKNLARFQRRRRRLCFNSESDPDPGSHSPQADRGAGVEGEQQPRQTPSPFLVTHRARSPVAASGAPKSCASCATRRTPLWRDAEDGTPLCNACGIRYRKYRVRCGSCWHIPRKDNKVFPACSQCGGVLRLAQARKC